MISGARKLRAMPLSQSAEKVLGKIQRRIDYPKSSLALKNSTIAIVGRPSYNQRRVLIEFRQCLKGARSLVVYDIGANRGQTASALAFAQSVIKVVAFEPSPKAFDELRALSQSETKIHPVNIALGAETSALSFYENASTASSSLLPMLEEHKRQFPFTAKASVLPVEVRRLDDLVAADGLPLPDIVKIDVQGYELQVLIGGTSTIPSAQWLLIELSLVTLYEGAASFKDLFDQISGMGFDFVEITDQLSGGDGRPLQVNGLFRNRATNAT